MSTIHSLHSIKSLILFHLLGTHGTGFCYTADDGKTLHSLESWPSSPTSYPKDLTAILYRGQAPLEIGYAARELFAVLGAEPPSPENNNGNGNESLRLVRHFKLLLDDPNHPSKDSLPLGLTLDQVLADYFSFVLKSVKKKLRSDLGPHAAISDVRWILTVPALLTPKAKNDLGEAALKAGLVQRSWGEENLMLLHEPEAAAIYAQVKVKDPRFSHYAPLLADRDVFMVLDAGGGTTDITIHKCIKSQGGAVRMEEATWATGAPLGSTLLDERFLSFFKDEVGEIAYDVWVKSQLGSQEILVVLDQWENIKCAFGRDESAPSHNLKAWLMSKTSRSVSSDDDDASRITVPPSLHALMAVEDRRRLDTEYGGSDSISLSFSVIKSFFDPTIDAIAALANQQMTKASELTHGIKVTKILLVGGLSSSPYVQSRLEKDLKRAASSKVIILDSPFAAVMQGGAIFGADPGIIRARRARYTYGIKCASAFIEGVDAEKNRFWHEEQNTFYANNVMTAFVKQGQLIETDEVVTQCFFPLYAHQDSTEMKIYLVDGKPVRSIDPHALNTTRKLASLTVFSDPDKPISARMIIASFSFGKTEITASAHETSTGGKFETSFLFSAES